MGSAGRAVLVDAGLHGREIERRLAASRLGAEAVEAVVVTHEHRDHIWGVGVWARRFRVPVYAARATWEAALRILPPRALHEVEVRFFEPGVAFEAATLKFSPIRTSHDAADSVGFRISDGEADLGFATDLGVASDRVRESLQGVSLLYLESNHDEGMLASGPYPERLKDRIRSDRGHLSNACCASLVADLAHGGMDTVVLGHLSETNNTPKRAYEATLAALGACGAAEDVTLLVARQDRPGRVVRLGG